MAIGFPKSFGKGGGYEKQIKCKKSQEREGGYQIQKGLGIQCDGKKTKQKKQRPNLKMVWRQKYQ